MLPDDSLLVHPVQEANVEAGADVSGVGKAHIMYDRPAALLSPCMHAPVAPRLDHAAFPWYPRTTTTTTMA